MAKTGKVRIRKRQFTEQSVYEAALERIRYCYEIYDDVVVSFSGGKDSTATLLCTLDVAHELGRLPVKAIFYDEEAIHPPTIEYVERVRARPDVDLEWYCLPLALRNACSNKQPTWYPWHPDEKEKWVRPMPENPITDHPRFRSGMSMQDFGREHFRNTNMVVLQGIRTQESLRRLRMMLNKHVENFISSGDGVNFAYPVYDWSSEDVWRLVSQRGEDYNRTYDILNRTSMFENFLRQRVCPPYGEEPLRGLWVYAECFPEMWEKMIHRVEGAATAARYGNTELYSSSRRPDAVNWRDYTANLIETYSDEGQKEVVANVNAAIRRHKQLTDDPIPQDTFHPLTGISWSFIAKIAVRGDFKARLRGDVTTNAQKAQIEMGITHAEAERLYGKKRPQYVEET